MKTKPTIAQIPSAYKTGKLYNVLPNDNNFDFTWTRGSSARRVNKDGLIELIGNDVPRLDYSNGGCPRLLLEDSSTNLLSNSNPRNVGVTNTNGTESDILLTNGLEGIKLETESGRVYTNIPITTTIGEEYVFSVYVDDFDVLNNDRVIYFLGESDNGTMFGSDIVIGRNELTFTATASSSTLRVGIGTSVTKSGFISFGGLQLEEGEFASSYIPTSGTIASRSADGGTLDNISSLLGNNATLFVQGSSDNDQAGGTLFFLDVNDVILGRYYFNQAGISNTSRTRLENPVSIFNSSFKENVKLALKHNNGVYTLFMNGQQINDATEQTLFGIDRIDLRGTALFTGGQTFIDKLFIYNEELTNEELINLTM